jgi:hypothetical protein
MIVAVLKEILSLEVNVLVYFYYACQISQFNSLLLK